MSFLSQNLQKLSLLASKKRHSKEEDADDVGDEVDESSVAGGGHLARHSALHRRSLRVSEAVQRFLVDRGELSDQDVRVGGEMAPALQTLLAKPHFHVPMELLSPDYSLPEYFVSSSHNTYLMAHQLYGASSAGAYTTALTSGSRCVEIDAWDNENDRDEPKVTHGYTLVSHIPFRTVCETIRDVMDKETQLARNDPAYQTSPVLISLENHCSPHGQRRLVHILQEVFGERLLSKALDSIGADLPDPAHVTLRLLGHRVLMIIEYHIPNEEEEETSQSSSSSSSDEEEEEKAARREYHRRKKQEHDSTIVPELAALGVYAQSVKPSNNSWFDPGTLLNGPHHHLINISETGLSKHMPHSNCKISQHNSKHLMRVFPKGTRISSKNLAPVKYWSLGAQICALNWQTFNGGMQLNEALFTGTDGFVLKPAALRVGGSGSILNGRKKRLRLHIAGASNLAPPKGYGKDTEGGEDWKPYVTCTLVHPGKTMGPNKRKTAVFKQHSKLAFLGGSSGQPSTDPLWDEVLEWEYEDSEMVFLRILIKADLSWAINPNLRVIAVRLHYIVSGWRFLHLTDFSGHETETNMLVKFEMEDI
ncbi:hypothetical protein TD95_004510 [Thielaviopsis punctulata]|uniref:Phosphoinositide phospholipase C n=1 Tax=Thielaviopsis punctulata TaxID=72032 RepID=A0A0F4ZGM3_9PEZI|nr:hypothetical protein TD95_004510 [Thielaviopsis punctulata]